GDSTEVYDPQTPDRDTILQSIDALLPDETNTSIITAPDTEIYLTSPESDVTNAFIFDPTIANFIEFDTVGEEIESIIEFGLNFFNPQEDITSYYNDWTVARALSDLGEAEYRAGVPLQALHTLTAAWQQLQKQAISETLAG